MSPQEINRRIHQAVGEPEHYEPSDFYHDLNAMHEAEQALTDPEWAWYMLEILGRTLRKHEPFKSTPLKIRRDLVSASAAVKAEAFLRTRGLWPVPQ